MQLVPAVRVPPDNAILPPVAVIEAPRPAQLAGLCVMFGVEATVIAAGLLGKLSVKPTAVRSLLGLGLVRVKAMVLLPLEDKIWFFVNSLLICGGITTFSVSVAMPAEPLFLTVIALLMNEMAVVIF